MSGFKHTNINELAGKPKVLHEGYEYCKKAFVPRSDGRESLVCVYEVPPGKSPYPYHYHLKDEETFYILSGQGSLRTPEGERAVKPGDFLFFPAGEEGAHKLTNISDSEKLVYIDFDVIHDVDLCIYPDSNKLGVWGKDVNRVYMLDENVDYYEGE